MSVIKAAAGKVALELAWLRAVKLAGPGAVSRETPTPQGQSPPVPA
jgi:hypothetical protein